MSTSAEPSPTGRSLAPVLLAWGLALVCLVAAVLGFSMAVGHPQPVPWRPLLIPLVWSVPGALIAVSRPRAALGWLNLAVAVMFSVSGLAQAWLGVGADADSSVAALALWFVDRLGALIVPVTTLALVLLPDSRLPSPRWRLPVAVAVAVQVTLVGLWSFSATPAASPDSVWPEDLAALANPVGFLPGEWAVRADAWVWLLQLPLLLCVAAMVARYRASTGVERARLVALLLAVVVLVAVILAGRAVLGPTASDVVDVLAALLLAVVLVSAVLRRHIEGVSLAVHHAFVFTALGVVVVAVYVVAVGALATLGPDLSRFGAGVVAAVAALAVHPLRARLQRWVDRLMHGDRRDPFAAVSRLADSAHRAPSLDEVLARVADSVAASLRVPWVRVEAFGAAGGTDPPGGHDAARSARVSLVAGEREVGSLVVLPQRGRRLRQDELRLLAELGRHAGVAVDAVHLAEEVAEHHRALVTAREEERRRLGRELHDDLGPTIAGLSMQLGALRPLVRSDPDAVVSRLGRLEQVAADCLDEVRHVAHQLRPPVLDQVGLGRAVRQLAESLDLVVVDEVVRHGPLPAAVELAAYRIAAEALTNVARHAGTRSVRVELRETAATLVLMVADDGRGPGGSGAAGLGTATMRERAEELGGTLSVRADDPRGTVVTAVLPVTTSAAVVAEERS